jgi:hypothetical protein
MNQYESSTSYWGTQFWPIATWKCPEMGIAPNSSILFSDFSRNKPSSYWGYRVAPFMELPPHGDFHKYGYPKRMIYNGQNDLKWMIWGYHYFRKPILLIEYWEVTAAPSSVLPRVSDPVRSERSWEHVLGEVSDWKNDPLKQTLMWKIYENIWKCIICQGETHWSP